MGRIASKRYVVVKFRDDVRLPPWPFTFEDIARQLPSGAESIDNRYRFEEHLAGSDSEGSKKARERAKRLNPDYHPPNFANYARIPVNDEADGEALVKRLRTWRNVHYVYLHPGAVEPPAPNPPDLARDADQVYLQPEPMGIDARYAWGIDGGRGEGQRLADVEWGWHQGHEDLKCQSFTNLQAGHYRKRDHGTEVLGIIASCDDQKYCLGVAHQVAHIVTVGQWISNDDVVTAPAVEKALESLDFGDVLLIEAQTVMYGKADIPLEAEPDVFEVVELATQSGVTVVAAAGNGAEDLDQVVDNEGKAVFEKDSKAIIVAAARLDSAPNWAPNKDSCVGSRINCFAQGTGVVTISSDFWGTQNYVNLTFGETSAAAAIIAGAALVIQGVAQENLGARLSPAALRTLMTDPALTTPAGSAAFRIGVMPDLRRIIDHMLASSPQRRRPQAELLKK